MFVPPQVAIETGQLTTDLPPSHCPEELVAKAMTPMPLLISPPVDIYVTPSAQDLASAVEQVAWSDQGLRSCSTS